MGMTLDRGLRLLCLLLAGALLAGCARLIAAPTLAGDAPRRLPQEGWARVLARHVTPRGEVDFTALARDRADLDRFVAWIYGTGPSSRPEQFPARADQLAYHLNAHHALVLYMLLEHGAPARLDRARRAELFQLRQVQVDGRALSLQQYADEVIRPLGDARLRLALTTLTKGAPALRRQPWRAATLEADLDAQARAFFATLRNFQVDAAGRKVWVSELLRAHEAEFLAEAPSLAAWIGRLRGAPLPEDYALDFIAQDWTLNAPRPPLAVLSEDAPGP